MLALRGARPEGVEDVGTRPRDSYKEVYRTQHKIHTSVVLILVESQTGAIIIRSTSLLIPSRVSAGAIITCAAGSEHVVLDVVCTVETAIRAWEEGESHLVAPARGHSFANLHSARFGRSSPQ